MKLVSLKIKNFRSYKDEVSIEIGDLTAIVGKNDIGKSTILEALDIFFNEGSGSIKLDLEDVNKESFRNGDYETIISACFEDLPVKIIIDSTNETTFEDEYLLNSRKQLEIIKKFSKAGKPNVFIKAYHPTNENCNDLLLLKDVKLREKITKEKIYCEDQSKNATMRKAIWNNYIEVLMLQEKEIEISKIDQKSFSEKIKNYLPIYTLFQSDRKNSDNDSEVQDPLKIAVKEIISNESLQQKFREIADVVDDKLNDVAKRTQAKINEMNPKIASTLTPKLPKFSDLKWQEVFKSVSFSGDDEIPINKRGSGIKRIILLNFFRAEAERRAEENDNKSIIYAIEEPETSQHFEHQKILIEALKNLSNLPSNQVLITTHSSTIVKNLEFSQLRLVDDSTIKTVKKVIPNQLSYPSLNEINYTAFSEITEEYHNELYGYITEKSSLTDFCNKDIKVDYIGQDKNGREKPVESISISTKIRHQIHHPENKRNTRFTTQELSESIEKMREFIDKNIKTVTE